MKLHYSKSARMSRSLIALHLFAIACSSYLIYWSWHSFAGHHSPYKSPILIPVGFIVLWLLSNLSLIFKCGPVAPLTIMGALFPFMYNYYRPWGYMDPIYMMFKSPLSGMFLGLLLENFLFKIKQPDDPQNENADDSIPPLPLANE